MQDIEFDFRRRNIGVIDHALAFEPLRQMRVVINRETIRPHANDKIQRFIEALHGLMRKPVYQIEGNGLKPGVASGQDEI